MHEKRAGVVIFDDLDLTQEQFDQPILWLLAALLFYMPAAFGCWEPWSESIAQAGACGLAILLAVKLLQRPDVPFVWSWTYLPIALFFLFGLLQITPLPAAWVGAISPKTVATYHWVLDDLPDAPARLQHLRINFYQEGAWHDLRNIFAVTCVFVVVINIFRRPAQMIQLLWLIAIAGTAEGLLSIAQNLTGTHAFYWMFPISWGDVSGGSFPNHNCFSQFMNLSSGAMVGLLLLKIDQTFRRRDYTPAEMMEKFASTDFRPAWILLAMLTISLASVFLSLSRGGMLSVAAAGVVVGILLALRGGARGMGIGGWLAGVILVAVFSIVMAGGANLVEGRIARIGNRDDRYDRYQLTKDAIRAWKDYPAVGMGLGSFAYTFPSYDRSNVVAIATHAEDEYAQLLEETGVVGATLAALFALMIFANFLRARPRFRKNRSSDHDHDLGHDEDAPHDPQHAETDVQTAPAGSSHSHRHRSGHRHGKKKMAASPASSLAMGICFGLVAVLLQSAFDFGQHCIAIASVTAIFCALLVNLASLRRRERGIESEPAPAHGHRLIRGAALIAVVIASACLLFQANTVRMATAAFHKEYDISQQLAAAGWKGDEGDFTDMNHFADEAVRIRPENIQFQYWRAMNRYYTISDVVDPVTGDVILTDQKRNILIGLADDLQKARWLCPLYGPLYCQLGQWERNSLGHPQEGAHYIRMAFELAPGDAVSCYVLAMLDAEEGKWADSITHFQRAAALETSRWQDAVNLYIGYFHRPDMAVKLAGDNVERLRQVAATLRAFGKDPNLGPTTGPATQPANEALAADAQRQADALVRAAADRPDASPQIEGEMGMMCFGQKDFSGAVKYLGRALKYEYGQADWRLAYAQSLAKLGNKDEAIRQAHIILRERPQMTQAQELIDRLNLPTTQSIDELYR